MSWISETVSLFFNYNRRWISRWSDSGVFVTSVGLIFFLNYFDRAREINSWCCRICAGRVHRWMLYLLIECKAGTQREVAAFFVFVTLPGLFCMLHTQRNINTIRVHEYATYFTKFTCLMIEFNIIEYRMCICCMRCVRCVRINVLRYAYVRWWWQCFRTHEFMSATFLQDYYLYVMMRSLYLQYYLKTKVFYLLYTFF